VSGHQAERTRLAWRRTTLATTGVSLLGAHLAIDRAAWLSLATLLAAWLTTVTVSQARISDLAAEQYGGVHRPVSITALLGLSLALIGCALTLIR
jgi:hypothetical protein